jgi:hypothetical protein
VADTVVLGTVGAGATVVVGGMIVSLWGTESGRPAIATPAPTLRIATIT